MTMTRAEARELRFDESEEELLARTSGPPDAVTQEPLSVLDVAAAILDERSPLDTWKLQKLCYYAQARHIASGHGRLFRKDIEAWAAGPVMRELYEQHRGRYSISTIGGGDLSTVRAVRRRWRPCGRCWPSSETGPVTSSASSPTVRRHGWKLAQEFPRRAGAPLVSRPPRSPATTGCSTSSPPTSRKPPPDPLLQQPGEQTPTMPGPRQSRESIGLTWGFGVADTR